jgi:hypothetical protein
VLLVDFVVSGLLPRLSALPEELVARRLAVPLLSRFVLLDETAVNHVVPHLLTPKPGQSYCVFFFFLFFFFHSCFWSVMFSSFFFLFLFFFDHLSLKAYSQLLFISTDHKCEQLNFKGFY